MLLLLVSLNCTARETVIIGAEDDWYPYSGVIDGNTVGLTADLVRASFAAVDIDVIFRPLPYARCVDLTRQGTLLACNEPVKTAENIDLYLWPEKPTLVARSVIYARSPSNETGLTAKSLENKHVAVKNGYEYGSEFDTNTNVKRETTNTALSLFRMLAGGRAEYGLEYEKVANQLFLDHASEFKGKFVAVGQTGDFPVYCAFSKTFPDSKRLLTLYDQGFAIIQKNGTYRNITKNWP
jgi:polar amino acid transport system substrate-binding protein